MLGSCGGLVRGGDIVGGMIVAAPPISQISPMLTSYQQFTHGDWRRTMLTAILLVYLIIKLVLDIKSVVVSILVAATASTTQASAGVNAANVATAAGAATASATQASAGVANVANAAGAAADCDTDYVVLNLETPLIKTTAGTCLHYPGCGLIKTVAQHRRTELSLCRQCVPKAGAKGKHE